MGKSYTKEVEVKNKWVLMGIITIVGVFLIYLSLSASGIVPNNYNLVDLINGNNKQSNNSSAEKYPVLPKPTTPSAVLMVYGIPKEVNVSNTPHTSWQISIEVQKGEVNNLSILIQPCKITNLTYNVTFSSSMWKKTLYGVEYIGKLYAGQIISFQFIINSNGNIKMGQTGEVMFSFSSYNGSYIVTNGNTNIDITS